MSANKNTVERYMDAYNRLDHGQILDCLTDEVEWQMPGAFRVFGKSAFDAQIESDCFTGLPVIVVTRMTEENGVVIAEGTVKSAMTDGGMLDALLRDVFEMRGGKIAKLISYVAAVSDSEKSTA